MRSLFSTTLKEIRLRRQLKQRDFAVGLGYEPSYISALENDLKPPPQDEKLDALLRKMDLSPTEETLLREAAKRSLRSTLRIKVPKTADRFTLEMYEMLQAKLPYISQVQVQMIKFALSVSETEERKM